MESAFFFVRLWDEKSIAASQHSIRVAPGID